MFTYWSAEPSVLIGIILVCALYALCAGPWRARFPDAQALTRLQVSCFVTAMLTLVGALLSPIGALDSQLFTLHMIQHLLLTLVFPPFLILGVPGWMLRPTLRWPFVRPFAQFVTKPLAAYAIFNATFSLWHVPTLYELLINNLGFHVLSHLIFMATAVITWWPICSSLRELPRMPYPAQILYLFMQGTIPTILGALLTFAATPLYPSYVQTAPLWGIEPLDDQIYAGLIMWIPGSTVFLIALTVVFFIWFEGTPQPGEMR